MSSAHDDHGHHGSRFIQHHYDDAQHQFDSGKFGIWLFLAQEVLFFSALFVAYILYRVHHPEIYSYAHKWLDVKYGAINTAVLIFSSLTAAWAVRCAQLNQRRGLILCIAVTIACAITFLFIKKIEYTHKYHEQILFGRYFDPCISPGGMELLTKSNECPGTKSTIKYTYEGDRGKPGAAPDGKAEGCYEASTIDQDPHTDGVQADCQVSEVKLALSKDADGKTVEKELSSRPVREQCEDELAEVLAGRGKSAPDQGSHKPKPAMCWRPAYQPAVCPDLTDVDKRAHGAASRPQVGIIVEYNDEEERGEDIKIKAECKPAPKAAAPAADLLADRDNKPGLGERGIKPIHILTTHEEHEVESLGPPPEHTGVFFTIYFAMTGLHGVHVLVGVIVFLWLLIRSIKGHFTPDYFGPVDYAALYWHIVDLIWIFLFPLLYLIH